MSYEKYLLRRNLGETTHILFERNGEITAIATYNASVDDWLPVNLKGASKAEIDLIEKCQEAVNSELIEIEYSEQRDPIMDRGDVA